MDTLSSSISTTFRVPSLHHPATNKSHVRNPHHHHHHHVVHPRHFSISSTSETRKTSATTLSNKATTTFVTPKQHSEPSGPIHFNHHKAVSGYAVALLDTARCSDALHLVKADVTRLSEYWLRNEQLRSVMADPRVGRGDKAEITRRVLKRAGYHKHLVKLVKLLVEKDKVEILSDVLAEFGRIYDTLSRNGFESKSNTAAVTQVVLVSADLKLRENQAMEIAEMVQKLSGGLGKVVVRQLVDHTRYIMPSLAL